jgi:hypothetical protein
MALLLNHHPDICLGVERYKYKFQRAKDYGPDDFALERFFDFRATDTNILPEADNQWADLYRTMRRKWPEAKIVGDKIPHLFDRLPRLVQAYPRAKLVFMVRNPRRVAASWNRRARAGNASWPAENDARRSVEVWNRANQKITRFRERGMEICVVSYERFYGGDPAELTRLQDHVGFVTDAGFTAAHEASCREYEAIARRPLELTPDEEVHIAETARWDIAEDLIGGPMARNGGS